MLAGLTASGVGYEADTGFVDYVHFRTYESSATEPPAAVVHRFVSDGLDGELRLTVTDDLGTRHLTVFRGGAHGSATYWHGEADHTSHWVSVAEHPPTGHPAWTMHTFFSDDALPVVLPFSVLHQALLEFLSTGHRPTTVPWQALPT
jgi:hypothetical protein